MSFGACRRKNVLQDVQVMRSKLIPRATSPQTRQINGKPQLRFVFIVQYFFFNLRKIVHNSNDVELYEKKEKKRLNYYL